MLLLLELLLELLLLLHVLTMPLEGGRFAPPSKHMVKYMQQQQQLQQQ